MGDVGRGAVRSAPLVLLGVGVVVVGVVVTLLGLGGVSAFDVSLKSFAFDSTSTGLAVIAIGGGLVAGFALDGPGNGDLARAAGDGTGDGNGGAVGIAVDSRVASAGTLVMGLGLMLYVASILF